MKHTIFLAKNIKTGKLVFIELGERYDQQTYQLMFSFTPEQVLEMFNACH